MSRDTMLHSKNYGWVRPLTSFWGDTNQPTTALDASHHSALFYPRRSARRPMKLSHSSVSVSTQRLPAPHHRLARELLTAREPLCLVHSWISSTSREERLAPNRVQRTFPGWSNCLFPLESLITWTQLTNHRDDECATKAGRSETL